MHRICILYFVNSPFQTALVNFRNTDECGFYFSNIKPRKMKLLNVTKQNLT